MTAVTGVLGQQAQQQGHSPVLATVGKALLFPSSVEALGEIADNLGTEVWCSPTAPYESSLTGQSAEELATAFEEATGQQWTQPLGFSHALFEVAAAATEEAGSTDAEAINSALDGLAVSSVVGDIEWGADEALPSYDARTPLTGGQWRMGEGENPFELVVVSNELAPEVPLGERGGAAAMTVAPAAPLLAVERVGVSRGGAGALEGRAVSTTARWRSPARRPVCGACW